MKLIENWPEKNLRCHFCGTGKSVKYEVEVMDPVVSSEPSVVYCCNRCALFLSSCDTSGNLSIGPSGFYSVPECESRSSFVLGQRGVGQSLGTHEMLKPAADQAARDAAKNGSDISLKKFDDAFEDLAAFEKENPQFDFEESKE